MKRELFTEQQIRAWEQLSRRRRAAGEGGSQRVAQWEIDGLHGMVERLMAVVSEGRDTLFMPDNRISIAWERYRELISDSQRLKQVEAWVKAGQSVTVKKVPINGAVLLGVGSEAEEVAPDLREAIDAHVRAGL